MSQAQAEAMCGFERSKTHLLRLAMPDHIMNGRPERFGAAACSARDGGIAA
jgi:hypothetical protein